MKEGSQSIEHKETQTDTLLSIIKPTEDHACKKVTFSDVRTIRELPSNRENEPPRRIGIPRRVKTTTDQKSTPNNQKVPFKMGRNLSKKLE